MKQLRYIFYDQLSMQISSLVGCNKKNDVIMLNENDIFFSKKNHHKKKLIFIISSMRHFHQELLACGYHCVYRKMSKPSNETTPIASIIETVKKHELDEITVCEPSDYDLYQCVLDWENQLNSRVTVTDDHRFLCSKETFRKWANSRKELRMEFFYREMRKRNNILMKDGKPLDGKWNFDRENRKSPNEKLSVPDIYSTEIDSITQEVIDLIDNQYATNFGDSRPFPYAVNRKGALDSLKKFVNERLSFFGDYQDAMIENEPWMYHAHISLYLNVGLLHPLECIEAAENSYQTEHAPINAVEGFIRQILGWREYVRGIYWLEMPAYRNLNYLESQYSLPEFYWDGQTELNCLHQCVSQTKKYAYAHHIQRLMVLGNFALLTGVHPDDLNDWFWAVYLDAHEWVELPNVSGMVLYADGGLLASKPYASGGAYINKMSNYCKNCTYKVSKKTGSDACPFNYLYWNFLSKNKKILGKNPRLSMMYRMLEKMPPKQKDAIETSSHAFIKNHLCQK